MFTVQQTQSFAKWFGALRDIKGRVAIARRITRMAAGNFGDSKSVGGGVSELRVDVGAGYRVYYTRRGNELVIVLAGGDKSTQDKDIERAHALAKEY